MKIRLLWHGLLPCLMCGYMAAADAAQASMQRSATVQPSGNTQQIQTQTGKLLESGPLILRGTLGDDHVQASLRSKAVPEEGFEGDYFLFGHSQKVLLAGEMDGTDVFMEESENGTDVSGQWNGKLDGNIVSGTWQSADGLITKPFTMKVVRNGSQPDAAAGRTSGAGKH